MKNSFTKPLHASRIALLAHAPYPELRGGIRSVVDMFQQTFPGLTIFPLERGSPNGSNPSRSNIWYVNLLKEGWRQAHLFKKRHREKPFDLLITYPAMGMFLNARRLKLPVIHIDFGCFEAFGRETMPPKAGNLFQRKWVGFLEKKSGEKKCGVTFSNKIKEEIKKFYGREDRVIPPGVDTPIFRPLDKKECRRQLGWKENLPTGLFVGRAEYAKGWDILLKAAEALPEVTFVCVTDQKGCAPIKNVVSKQGVPLAEMVLWYNAADFFLFPTRYESAAIVVSEAMACNLPVVISTTAAQVCLEKAKPLGPKEGVHIISEQSLEKYLQAIRLSLQEGKRGETAFYVWEHRSLKKFRQNYRNLAESLLFQYP